MCWWLVGAGVVESLVAVAVERAATFRPLGCISRLARQRLWWALVVPRDPASLGGRQGRQVESGHFLPLAVVAAVQPSERAKSAAPVVAVVVSARPLAALAFLRKETLVATPSTQVETEAVAVVVPVP